jgi:hypothetical protein
VAYAPVNVAAAGGVPPYQWQISTGFLPPGLHLSGNSVAGTPTSPNTWYFTVRVLDAAGHSASAKRSIAVYRALTMTQPCVGQCVIGKGCTKCGVFGTAIRGLAPYTYKIVGGAVPPGMTWKQLSLVGGFPAGGYSLSVQVTDKLGARVTVGANWSIYNPATLLKGRTGDCIDHTSSQSCTATWTYNGGSPAVVPKLVIVGYSPYSTYPVPTAPPPGWSVSLKSGQITMSAKSTACVTSYGGYITFELRDPSTCATTVANRGTMLVDLQYSC